MIKKWHFYSTLLLIIAFLSSGFKPYNSQIGNFLFTDENEEQSYVFPSQNSIDYFKLKVPFTGRYFIGFKEAVAHKESQGKYGKINSLGYMGKYQFGRSTLRHIGVYNFKNFLDNPNLQENAFYALLCINKWELRKEIKNYSGRIINGIKITESGLLAAAHLAGASSVKAYLRSNGKNGFKDGFGTSLRSYIKRFNGYDTSNVVSNRFAKVTD